MHHQIAYTTAQLAQIAGTDRSMIYGAIHRAGHWRGLRPRKQPNGRLIWPRREVLDALGLVDIDHHAPGVRAGAALIEAAGGVVTPETMRTLAAVLTPLGDGGDHTPWDAITWLAETAMATCQGCDAQARVSRHYARTAATSMRAIADDLLACADSLDALGV